MTTPDVGKDIKKNEGHRVKTKYLQHHKVNKLQIFDSRTKTELF